VSPHRKRSKAGILLELFLDATLLFIFALQAFILGCLLTYGHIPVPKDWASKRVATYLPEGFRLEAETIRLKLNGEIELSNVYAWSDSINHPILESNNAVIHLHFDKANGYLPQVKNLVISNGTLYLPAVYSPDGLRRPILEKTAFRLIPEVGMIRIDSFAALHESIRLRGSIEWPIVPPSSTTPPLAERIGNFYQSISVAMAERDRFNIFTTPTVAFHLTTDQTDRSVKLTTAVSSRALKHPLATGQNFRAHTKIRIKDRQILAESDLRINAKQLNMPSHSISCSGLDAIIDKNDWQTLLNGQLPDLQLFARKLTVHEIDLTAPIIKVRPSDYPNISFEGATSGLKGAVTFSGTINATHLSGNVHAKGSVDLVSLIPGELAEALPALNFEKAPYYDLKLQFADDFALKAAYLNADAYGVSVDGITFDHIDARASFKDNIYSLDQVYARRDWQWVDLGFHLDTRTWDYKVSLIGSAVPYDYNSILPRWWAAIFKDFDFSEVQENHGDFIIYGNAKQSVCDLYYGHAFAEKVRFMDVMVDSATTTVRGRGRYSEVTDIDAVSNGGWAKGTIAFASLPDEINAPVSIRMHFDAQLALDDSKKLFGENIANILNDFEPSAQPTVTLTGAIFNKAYPHYSGLSYFDLKATSNGAIKYKGVPLDHLDFSLFGRDHITHIRDLTFGYADGLGSGAIDILTPPQGEATLRYHISLKDADQDQAIRNLPQLDTIEGDLANGNKAQADKNGREEGRIDARLHAQGPADNPYLHNGYGSFTIRSKQLGAIQLLGPLSRLLQNTRFSFTSFNLDKMIGAFDLDNGMITFDTLDINGPRTRISAPGTMTLDEQALNMRVTVNLFANVGSPDSPIKRVGNLITSPIPNLLVFDLTGTVKNQKWRSLYDPRKLIPTF